MSKAIYPGTFDPMTYGHLDIIERASKMFDEVVVVIMNNAKKTNLFTPEERLEMLTQALDQYSNVKVMVGEGLTVDFAKKVGANIMIRGLRAVMDFEYELQIATSNMWLNGEIETIFLVTKPELSFISSSTVKEIAANDGNISHFVNAFVASKLAEKLGSKL